ncbi:MULTISPECIES: hypothetical protein [unclassified Paracoccus (in: a-proteobacteria)]|uniref:hypothetical protein n=1 Tax=unclassified Paracoccus (in: a-proteobacteria) TaxID=2688777 RepID=UPI0021E18640|nr:MULTISPECIES: hypothetical protein [unclassified Paracoccus (in: a-proteobacteria)]UXU76516.1 hypothetical protein GB879_014160 [Paracoccus sp. SMMA_5]UXU82417.1 hypothetical protein GB880_014275 [Paracoccus sp. SMMA_5_TC]
MTHPTPAPLLAALTRHMLRQQGRDGLWGAFRMGPGQSREWVGAVAALALAQAGHSGRLPAPLAARALDAAGVAADRLLAMARPAGGWGYHPDLPADSDSTAAVLRLLAALDRPPPAAASDFLLAQGDVHDGWATYGPMRRWDAWSLPCPEVDAACGLALAGAGALGPAALCKLWRQRLAPLQDKAGHWRAYWWPGPGVATVTAIELWHAAGRPEPPPRWPQPADPAAASLDRLLIAHARALLDPAGGSAALIAEIARPQPFPAAEARLLAPPRYPASARGEESLEGAGVFTLAAAMRALGACELPPRVRPPRPAAPARVEGLARGLRELAEAQGLPTDPAATLTQAAMALLRPLISAPLPWPNPAVSSLARGWPLEFSAPLSPQPHPALRLACDLGDPRLPGPARARVAKGSLLRAAAWLGLDAAPMVAALCPLMAAFAAAPVGDDRFWLWGGLDATWQDGRLIPVLKLYANLAHAGPDSGARLDLAERVHLALGGNRIRDGLADLDAAMAPTARPQQIGLAVAPQARVGAKIYWELPAHDPVATRRAAACLGMSLPPGFDPTIPGLLSHAQAGRVLSGLAVRLDPQAGICADLTLATRAERQVIWRPEHEYAALAGWATNLGLDPQSLLQLMTDLRRAGEARRSLHTLTLDRRGRLRAAVYLHPDGWLSRLMADGRPPLSIPVGRHPQPAATVGVLP